MKWTEQQKIDLITYVSRNASTEQIAITFNCKIKDVYQMMTILGITGPKVRGIRKLFHLVKPHEIREIDYITYAASYRVSRPRALLKCMYAIHAKRIAKLDAPGWSDYQDKMMLDNYRESKKPILVYKELFPKKDESEIIERLSLIALNNPKLREKMI